MTYFLMVVNVDVNAGHEEHNLVLSIDSIGINLFFSSILLRK